jgi:hypothetical protein
MATGAARIEAGASRGKQGWADDPALCAFECELAVDRRRCIGGMIFLALGTGMIFGSRPGAASMQGR